MTATTKIRFTRQTNALGEREYHYETDTHRYITSQRDGRKGWWVTRIYKLERVGTMDPPLMVRGDFVTNLLNITLAEARVEIAQDAERRAPKSAVVSATVGETVEPTDAGAVEDPVRTVQTADGVHPADRHDQTIRKALRALQGVTLARISRDFRDTSGLNGVRLEPMGSGSVRASWLTRGNTCTPNYEPPTEELGVIVDAFRKAGWMSRIEGNYHVAAWGVPSDDDN